ncbi:hypothetical protein GGX14DRAFT_368863, partial [Mycena pura]
VMHPSYRFIYFEKQNWPQDWKDQALSLARAQWTRHYKVNSPRTAPGQVCRICAGPTPVTC